MAADLHITKYTQQELVELFQKNSFKNFDPVPISKMRMASYINNPNGNADDFVLYLAWLDDKMVGFRSIFADRMYAINKAEKMGWFSGTWVHPDFRRMGISTKLFNEVKKDWKHRLAYTNYAPNSKKLFDKTGDFTELTKREGLRFYFTSPFYRVLGNRNSFFKRIKTPLKFLDFLTNFIIRPYSYGFQKKYKSRQNTIEKLGPTNIEKLSETYNNSVFPRALSEFRWILSYPWITTDFFNENYPFSLHAKRFGYYLVSDERTSAVALLKLRDEHLSIPYFFGESCSEELTKNILSFAVQKKIELFTCYNPIVLKAISKEKKCWLASKKMIQRYFIMKEFAAQLALDSDTIQVQDGDGDCVFT